MKIEQFEDKGLAHYSYAILSESAREIMLVSPARDPQPYYDFESASAAIPRSLRKRSSVLAT